MLVLCRGDVEGRFFDDAEQHVVRTHMELVLLEAQRHAASPRLLNQKRAVSFSQTPKEGQSPRRGENPRGHGFDWTLVNRVVPLQRCYRSATDERVVAGVDASAMEGFQISLQSGRPN